MVFKVFNPTSYSGQCVTGAVGVRAFHNCVYLKKSSFFLLSNFNILLQQTEAKKKKRSSEEHEKITVRHLPSSIQSQRMDQNSAKRIVFFLSVNINICRTNPRRRGKRSTRNTAGRRKRRRHLSRTQNWTDDRGLRRSPHPLPQFTKNRFFPSKKMCLIHLKTSTRHPQTC